MASDPDHDDAGVRSYFKDLDRLREEKRIGLGQWARRAQISFNTLKNWRLSRKRLSDWPWFQVREVVAAVVGDDQDALRPWKERWEALRQKAPGNRGPIPVSADTRPLDNIEIQPDPAAREAPPAVPPRQLPTGIPGLVGRQAELDWLDADLANSDNDQNHGPIVVIEGMAGVGKTALAIHWCRRIAHRFPDGQLYVDLSGHGPTAPARPNKVLARFLRALGVDRDNIPMSVDEAACLFRSILSDRRVLILLDNARDTTQVRPLLPGSATAAVIITSRSRLGGLIAREGAHVLSLKVLTQSPAQALLTDIIGGDRATNEPEAMSNLAQYCAGLPLALGIVGERVAARPQYSLTDLAAEFADVRSRLNALVTTDQDLAVQAAFSWSYQGLPARTARVFRLLSLHAGADISIFAASALVGLPLAETGRLIDSLTTAHLIEEPVRGRYRFHDLMHCYARECAELQDSTQERVDACRRVLTWYLYTAAEADRRLLLGRQVRVPLDPDSSTSWQPLSFTNHDQAMNWCKTEHANLVATVTLAEQIGEHVIAWKLPAALWSFYYLQRPVTDWIETYRIGLRAARHLGDRFGLAWILNGLGVAHWSVSRLDKAQRYYCQALTYWQKIENKRGEAITLNNLAAAHAEAGPAQFDEAHARFHQALAIRHDIDDLPGVAQTLANLAQFCCDSQRFEEAIEYCEQALTVYRQLVPRMPVGEANAMHNLAVAHHGLRCVDTALGFYEQALNMRRAIGDQEGQSDTLTMIGDAYEDAGQSSAARQAWQEAFDILERMGDVRAADLHARLRGPAPAGQ